MSGASPRSRLVVLPLHVMKNAHSETLRVTLVQSDLHWEDKAANLRDMERRLEGLQGKTDVIVLPEMFTTGFTMSPAPLAEGMDGKTMSWLFDMASATGAVVTGSFIAEQQGAFFNRLVWMQPDGHYRHYDKRHLFSLAGEHQQYQQGQHKLIVEWKGWRVCPLICYDVRFPVWSRNTENYDLLLYVANFPERRIFAWKSLLVARAIENQAYTVGVNRIGTDGNGHYHSGDSCVLDFAGNLLYCAAHLEAVHTITLHKAPLQAFRTQMPFLADRDPFHIAE